MIEPGDGEKGAEGRSEKRAPDGGAADRLGDIFLEPNRKGAEEPMSERSWRAA